MSTANVTLDRLENQIIWYGKKAVYNERMFKRLRVATIVVSSSIALFAAFLEYRWITGGLGALIALFEAVQQLNQYHQNWISYRSTAEALKREKYLFLSMAGAYAWSENAKTLLAERVESLVSQEHAKWQEYSQWPAANGQLAREKPAFTN